MECYRLVKDDVILRLTRCRFSCTEVRRAVNQLHTVQVIDSMGSLIVRIDQLESVDSPAA